MEEEEEEEGEGSGREEGGEGEEVEGRPMNNAHPFPKQSLHSEMSAHNSLSGDLCLSGRVFEGIPKL